MLTTSTRIAAGGICHETSTFTPVPTTRADFDTGFGFYRGEEILARFRGSNVPIGGFIDGAEQLGFELIPLLWTFPYPAGVPRREIYEEIKSEFLARLEAVLPVNGVLLDQHGAMVVEGEHDADADLIEGVRELIGPDRPIVVTCDLHANHSARRIATADAIIGFKTYPHVDQAERGREAADLVVRVIRGTLRPTAALVRVPVFWHPAKQITGVPPWTEVTERVEQLRAEFGVATATLATGFFFADVPHRGPSVIVVTDNDEASAHWHARELADWIWSRRADWLGSVFTIDEALAEGEASGRYPIILADHADNTGGGSPGDSTEILRAFIERRLKGALILYMVDPEVVGAAHEAGVGATISVSVGGRNHPAQGRPVEMRADVVGLSDGRFRYDGPMYGGLEGDLGPSAAIRQEGVTVICVTKREQPIDTALARTLGVDCGSMRYICVKSAVHFRSGFEAIGGVIYNVDAASVHSLDPRRLNYVTARSLDAAGLP